MKDIENRVIIDTDFLNKITQANGIDGKSLFIRMMSLLGRKPVVHWYVAENEMCVNNPVAKALLDTGIIEIIRPGDFLKNSEDLNDYEYYYKKWFNYMNPDDRLCEHECPNVFTFRKAGRSLGEIHSILLAKFTGIPLFMSDDRDAKDLVHYAGLEKSIQVYNLEDTYKEIGRMKGKKITLSEVRAVVNPAGDPNKKAARRAKERYMRIKEEWQTDDLF